MTLNKKITGLGVDLILNAIVFALACVLLGLLLAGCTVTPDQVHANVPSFDGGDQNSGIISEMPGGEWSVTAHWRDRFNALSAKYGTNFIPRIAADAGITPATNGTFIATSQAVANFGKMNLLYKSQPR